MEKEKKDVDMYEELDKALDESKEQEPDGASSEKPEPEVETGKEKQPKIENERELSEEEISKLSPRAQKRIRDLADQVKDLAKKQDQEEKPAPDDSQEDKPEAEFKNVQEFLAAVQDEPSRKLLNHFYNLIKAENQVILAPIEQRNRETQFETEFAQYEKIEGLSDHKDDMRKTFMRNPNTSVKALVGEVVTDLQLTKIKPAERDLSDPKRDGKVDLDNLDKEGLYNLLETNRPT